MTTVAPPRERIAVIKGVFAKPGVSKNRRWYKPEHIRAAAEEAQGLIDSGANLTVLSMLTHHGARDPKAGDVRATAGRLTKVGVNGQGWGVWEADVADSGAGHDIAALTVPDDQGRPTYLKGVSMASVWKGEPRRVRAPDGEAAITSDAGFSLKGIDFTHNPGIDVAHITSSELVEEALAEGELIYESLEEAVRMEVESEIVIEEGKGDPTPDATVYADPGYQKDGKKRYALNGPDGSLDKKRIRAAWSFINQGDNASRYSATQVKRIKGKIKSAAKKTGVNITEDLQLMGREILEAYAAMSMDNGPGSVNISTYGVDPKDLDKAGAVVAMAALAALAQLDPDMDGDLDLDRFDDPNEDDDDMEGVQCGSCNADVPTGSLYCPQCGQPIAVTETSSATGEKGATMPESTNKPGAAANESVTLSKDELKSTVDEAVKSALEAAGVKPTEVIEESEDLKKARELLESADVAAARKLIEEAEGKPSEKPAPKPVSTDASETAGITADDVAAAVEAALTKQNEAFESTLTDLRKDIGRSGTRRGLITKAIEEQSEEEIYGEEGPGDHGLNLRGKSLTDLTSIADAAMAPLLGA